MTENLSPLYEVTEGFKAFWVAWGRNARRLFPEHGLEWATPEVRSPHIAELIREGWEAETKRLMALN